MNKEIRFTFLLEEDEQQQQFASRRLSLHGRQQRHPSDTKSFAAVVDADAGRRSLSRTCHHNHLISAMPPPACAEHLFDLPDEILIMIVDQLQVEERLRVREVSQRMKLLVESQLKLVKSLKVTGRSLKSLLDYVKDAKAKDLKSPESCQFTSHNSITKVIRFDQVCRLIYHYFTGLVSVRFHRMTFTFGGLRLLQSSQSWQKMEYLVIRSCYMDQANFADVVAKHGPKWYFPVKSDSLKQLLHFPITSNHSLEQVIRFDLLQAFSYESLPSGWISYNELSWK